MHKIPLPGNAFLDQAVIIQIIQHQLVLVFLLGTFTQLLLQGANLAFLDHTFYHAVVTCHKNNKQEQNKHNPVLVLAYKTLS